MKEQVLSIDQIKELIDLGFNVSKYSSIDVNITKGKQEQEFITGKMFSHLFPSLNSDFIEDTYSSMTIGDIINVLPTTIYYLEKYAVQFILEKTFHGYVIKYDNIHKSLRETVGIPFSIYKDNLRDALFEALKYCIINKHIDIN